MKTAGAVNFTGEMARGQYVLALPRLAERVRRSGRRELVRQRDPLAADGVARRRAEVGIRLNASELRALDEGVEESCDLGAAFRA